MSSEDVLEYLITAEIYTYRLSNGDVIIAEEVYEHEDDRLFVSVPALLVSLLDTDHDQDFALAPWEMFPSSSLVELNSNNIISKVESTMSLKAHYFNFVLCNKDTSNPDDELDEAFDILDDFITNNCSFDYSQRWQWKPELN